MALEFWNLMQADRAGAWKKYLGLVKLAGTRTFTELVASAGLDTPFGDDALRTVSAAASGGWSRWTPPPWPETIDLSRRARRSPRGGRAPSPDTKSACGFVSSVIH